ncbi:DUF4864 domain-containing protein [Aureimonas endophytica]|uniref:DUF4864 domain-containing protein n=1 Tax=Aureimonas endophytica TaxID=2027858 RepID=A0A917E0E4_9HYPH|nr:DUF4864 domain-containing protein [Aureimonas endophytica]GGD88829.1 DUF4864 domain-containing protein [Aureimonas endophytica]
MPSSRILLFLAAALSFSAPLVARADDAGDIQAVISAQLNAFKAGDGAAAYSYAAPGIKAMFPSPDSFMAMVRGGYAVVADARNVTFGPLQAEGGGFRQDVNMTDAKGQSYIASYTLSRQPDGSLKITSCRIRKGEDVSA